MDFPLPCPDGSGQPLDRAAFAALRRRHPSPVFFSPELCARYFTYSDGESAHFVLFDDARTLRRKLRLAREAGIDDAFFMYPEVADLAQELFAPGLEAPFDSQRQI
jgi:hypothetical protein